MIENETRYCSCMVSRPCGSQMKTFSQTLYVFHDKSKPRLLCCNKQNKSVLTIPMTPPGLSGGMPNGQGGIDILLIAQTEHSVFVPYKNSPMHISNAWGLYILGERSNYALNTPLNSVSACDSVSDVVSLIALSLEIVSRISGYLSVKKARNSGSKRLIAVTGRSSR
jgi:hypothetical protein